MITQVPLEGVDAVGVVALLGLGQPKSQIALPVRTMFRKALNKIAGVKTCESQRVRETAMTYAGALNQPDQYSTKLDEIAKGSGILGLWGIAHDLDRLSDTNKVRRTTSSNTAKRRAWFTVLYESLSERHIWIKLKMHVAEHANYCSAVIFDSPSLYGLRANRVSCKLNNLILSA